MNQQTEVTIRAAEPDDFGALQAIYAGPGACFGTLQMPFPSKEMWKQRLQNPTTERHNLVACINDVPIGNIGLMPETRTLRRRHAGHIGMGVHDNHVGRGVGEMLMRAAIDLADNWINLTRLELTVWTDNSRAISLYKRTGFAVEGTLRQYAFRDGVYIDALSMARLR